MKIFSRFGAALLLLPALCWAGSAVLLDEPKLSALIAKNSEYQLLDARSVEAQRAAPIAFSTAYRVTTPIGKGLVLVVADDDATAEKIAQSIPAAGNRIVHAVQGGNETWRRVIANSPATPSVSGTFVIPKNTCEQGKPIQELKRDKPLQQFKTH